MIFSLKLTGDWTGVNRQQCEAEQNEAGVPAGNEEARMNDLEGQLQGLDPVLARTAWASAMR